MKQGEVEETRGKLTPSLEDYLEAVALLQEKGEVARVKQIGQTLEVRMPSVIAALDRLSKDGFVEHERYGYVKLTPQGAEIAQDVVRRHELLRRFLMEILDVDPETAKKDACKMEHIISPVTQDRLVKFLEFIENCPRGEPDLLKFIRYYFEYGERPEECVARCPK